MLRRTAARVPDKAALHVAGEPSQSVTFRRLDEEAGKVAAGLAAAGISKGDRVALMMPNTPYFVFSYFGILRAGGVVVPLNTMLTEVEVSRILDDSGAKAVLVAPPCVEVASRAAASCTPAPKVFSSDDWGSLAGTGRPVPEVEVSDEDVAVLAYTSGTTGEPKGAMLTHRNLYSNLEQQMSVPGGEVEERDVLLLALPLFHIYGLNVALGLLVMNGASGLLLDGFEPQSSLRYLQEHGVTVILGAPPMYKAWIAAAAGGDYDLSSVRLAVSGAAALPPDVLEQFRRIFGIEIYEGYGLTETAPTLTSNRMSTSPLPNSIGKPLPGVELRIVNEGGEDVELGDTGEIVVRGPNVFKGYWNRDEETQKVFRDGWFCTGDVAVQDEEGHLFLVDRKRDLIIVSGFNVFPSEVENALIDDPRVAEAAVIGIPHPYSGEAVKAFVVLEPGADATTEDIAERLHTRLARFKWPSELDIVPELPRQLTGKVLRRALRT